ncbi:hypothetical protein BGZ94_002000 [Podila epigama]|nr:hypothetical protein BGZ94_002000 [Podila epigama]
MSLTKTGEQQQRFHVKQQIRDIEMLVQSLSDMTNLTEIVDLLDTTLTRFQHNRKGAVHRRRVKRLDTHTTTKRSTAVQWNLNDSHHRHHHHQRRRSSISATSSSSSRGKERATENRKDKASKEPLPSESTTSPQDESFSGEEQNASKGKERENQTVDTPTSTKDDKGPSHDHSQGSGMAKASRPRKREPVLITTAFVRTQIVLDEIRKDYNDRLRFARRLSLLSAFLLIREKRLTWMVDEIKSYEEEQAQASENEVGHVMRNKIPRPKVLVQTSHQRVISLLHTERHNQGQQRELHRRLPSVDPSMFSFGPDLEAMDLDKFLQDPYERARIIRLELEAMREELLVFGKVIMKT